MRAAALTLSSMSFHCFCHRVSGATITLPPMLVASLRRDSSYARVAEAVVFSGSMAAATCAIESALGERSALFGRCRDAVECPGGGWCSVAVPLLLSPYSDSNVGQTHCTAAEHGPEHWLSECAPSHLVTESGD